MPPEDKLSAAAERAFATRRRRRFRLGQRSRGSNALVKPWRGASVERSTPASALPPERRRDRGRGCSAPRGGSWQSSWPSRRSALGELRSEHRTGILHGDDTRRVRGAARGSRSGPRAHRVGSRSGSGSPSARRIMSRFTWISVPAAAGSRVTRLDAVARRERAALFDRLRHDVGQRQRDSLEVARRVEREPESSKLSMMCPSDAQDETTSSSAS